MLRLCSIELSDQCLNCLAVGPRDTLNKNWVCPVCTRLKKPEMLQVIVFSLGNLSHTEKEDAS